MSGKMQIKLKVNGEDHEFLAEPRELLVHALRERLNLTGSHVGCETGPCGVCTVTLNGKSVKSCTMFVAQADGAELTTVEGMGSPDNLHVLQEAFREHHGLQCGSCTPGMIMRAAKLLEEIPNPTEEQVRFGMAGNLCRCTGYQNIVKSIMAAASEMNSAKEAAQ